MSLVHSISVRHKTSSKKISALHFFLYQTDGRQNRKTKIENAIYDTTAADHTKMLTRIQITENLQSV